MIRLFIDEQGTEETLDHNWERSSNSKVEILLQFCKMRKQANWTRILNYSNLNCLLAEGMLREKQKEVLMNCEDCRTWDTMSTGRDLNLFSEIDFWSGSGRSLFYYLSQGGGLIWFVREEILYFWWLSRRIFDLNWFLMIIREEMVVGRRMKRSSVSFDETPHIVHPVVSVAWISTDKMPFDKLTWHDNIYVCHLHW